MGYDVKLVKGETFETEIVSAAYEGVGVARIDDLVVFVRGGVPGDRVLARIRRLKRRYAEATVEQVIEPSAQRVAPVCPHFLVCGGCAWQNASYELQLQFKRDQVKELLSRIGGLQDLAVEPALPSPRQYHYRNKMEFTFANRRWLTKEEIATSEPAARHFALGLHVPQRFDKVLDIDACYLAMPVSADILNHVRILAQEKGWEPYDTIQHVGYLRNLVIRGSEHSQEILINLVTSERCPERMKLFTTEIALRFPQVTSIVNSVNSSRSPVASGEEEVCLGTGSLVEKIGHITYLLEASTFFQPNTLQAERLYGVVRDFAQLTGREKLLDLYCGIGGITLFLAGHVSQATGVENQKAAVELARRNAEMNLIRNCEFIESDAAGYLKEVAGEPVARPDVVTVDPPRVGMHPDLVHSLLRLNPPRIVYVSCNPATQARDLAILNKNYTVERVQPVDMFPQTYHIENVVALRRR